MALRKWIIRSLASLFCCMLLLHTIAQPSSNQDTIVTLSSKDFNANGFLKLYGKGGWYFRSGNDSSWANTTIDMTGWKALLPRNLDAGYTDANGKLEGWFRFKFMIDSSLANVPWRLMYQPYAAGEVYIDGQQSLDRARENWQKLGRSEKWIQQRMTGQETRNKLTDYWKESGVEKNDEFAFLTNIIHTEWAGLSVKQHKNLKGLKTQNLRDHMSEA